MHLIGSTRIAFAAAVVGSFLLAAGCSSRSDMAIEVVIEVDPAVKSTCIRLAARSAGRDEVLSAPTPRKDRIAAAIYPTAELSGAVSFVARGYLGKDCEEPLTLNDESAAASETFTKGQIRHLVLALKGPGPGLDSDADGYRADTAGGLDCLDTNPAVAPGLAEACGDGIDNNCDSLTDCGDPGCFSGVCSDGDFCTKGDRCLGDGGCAGTPVNCTVSADLACTVTGACNPANGDCVYSRVDAGHPCDDGDSCTGSDQCQADAGCRGAPVTCASPPGACFAALGVCIRDGGACAYPPRDAGSACDDGDLCTSGESCSSGGSCDGVAVSCNTPPGQCFTAAGGACFPDAGCTYPVATGPCSDGDSCTLGESCQADGSCAGGTAFTCAAPPGPCFSPAGTCLLDAGCDYPVNPATLYLPCDGGVCQADGGCQTASFPYAPSNFDPAAVADGGITASVTLNCLADFDSSPGAATPFLGWCGQAQPALQLAPQDGGPDAVVLAMYSFNLISPGVLRIRGSRPVILAVYDSAQITGDLLATATLNVPGPGGSSPACGAGTGGAGSSSGGRSGGGGGGGFATRGGNGGLGSGVAATSGPGGSDGGSLTLAPLRGGCSGGAGGGAIAEAGAGGAGGGAIQLSVAGALTVAGTISASGGGGQGAAANSAGGGAGGSGGAVLLEAGALAISSTAKITANGGGGGEGSFAGSSGGDGLNGAVSSATPAAGGSSGPAQGGNGGSGGAGTTLPAAGLGSAGNQSGGGGGGAFGRIRFSGNGTCAVNASAVVSPPASTQGCP
ncbi:MAG: putative metal-binding motif-containing protein [Myxococcaceae bacterium]